MALFNIGGAVALAAWGETRTTRDLDLVIELPVESVAALSLALERRHMLVPVDIMLDLLIEDRADPPINAIHMVTGYKAEMFHLKPGDALRQSGLERRRLEDLGPPYGKVFVHSPEGLDQPYQPPRPPPSTTPASTFAYSPVTSPSPDLYTCSEIDSFRSLGATRRGTEFRPLASRV